MKNQIFLNLKILKYEEIIARLGNLHHLNLCCALTSAFFWSIALENPATKLYVKKCPFGGSGGMFACKNPLPKWLNSSVGPLQSPRTSNLKVASCRNSQMKEWVPVVGAALRFDPAFVILDLISPVFNVRAMDLCLQ